MYWKLYKPNTAMPWNLKRVVHLHRRAGFGADWNSLQRNLKEGHRAAVDRLLQGMSQSQSHEFDVLSDSIAESAVASTTPKRLQAWWIYRMLRSADPLGERLTLMWHNHFATSNRKVKNLGLMRQQNDLFRTKGRGRFEDLLSSVVKHPAMLLWLDADSNRKGRANENLAREMLELFTLGVGNFTEQDVKHSARALTGWAVIQDQFEYREARHDDGELEILGKSKPFTGDQLIELLLKHPSTAKRITWRLCKTFMSESFVQSDKAAVEELAKGLIDNDLNIEWAVATILNSEFFFRDSNIRSKVLGPAEYVIGVVRSLELSDPPPRTIVLSDWLSRIGLDLFYPPNVGGWSEGRSWPGSRQVIARSNFASSLSDGKLRSNTDDDWLEQLLAGHAVGNEIGEKVSWLAKLLWGVVPESTVAEVVEQIAAKKVKAESQSAAAVQLLLSRPENLLG